MMVASSRKISTGSAPFFNNLILAPKPTLVKKKSIKASFKVSLNSKVRIPV